MSGENKIDVARTCSFCNSEEGKNRLVGNFIVELKEVVIQNERKLACQSCRVKCRDGIETRRQLAKEKIKEFGWLARISNLF